jgi:death on curing protein
MNTNGCWMNSTSDDVRYLSVSEIYNINDEVTEGHTFVRDVHLLQSAAARPAIHLYGEAQFPTLVDKAAALLHSLAYHHLFADGNKRTAARALTQFLGHNGYALTWDEATQQAFVLEVAQGKHDVPAIAVQLARFLRAA